MLTRRKLLLAVGISAALPALPAMARDDVLLADILHGVSDALIRNYIREHYEEGRWDGHYWHRHGRRYSPREYRIYLVDEYHRHPGWKPKHWKRKHKDWGTGTTMTGTTVRITARRAAVARTMTRTMIDR